MSALNSSLYWSLPSAMEFAEKVRNATLKYRVIVLSFPEFMCVNPSKTIENALTNAGFNDAVILHIQGGMNISAEVGTHFSASTMPADSLAHFVCGRPQAVVLHAKGTKAQESCNHYAAAFLEALDKSAGNVRLIIALRSGDYQADQAKGVWWSSFFGHINRLLFYRFTLESVG